MRLPVIVPTYNERENLPKLVPQLLEAPDGHVLVMDRASPGGAGMLADQLARQSDRRVSVVDRVGPRGLGWEHDTPTHDTRPCIWLEGMPWWVLPLISLLSVQPIILIVKAIAG
jgi:hypothetical protein